MAISYALAVRARNLTWQITYETQALVRVEAKEAVPVSYLLEIPLALMRTTKNVAEKVQ